ncbi:MAG: 4Fe-4S binding protein [Armatimonadetes bacterium]|nr:4Fe-4S binding protein [Armatimonadota bacterium]
MPDISVDFCGIRLRNPIVAAPAGITENADRLKRCEDAGCGAAVIKSYFEYEPARHSPSPRFKLLRHQLGKDRTFSLYSFEQANVHGLDEFGEQIRIATEQCEMPIFSSLNCNTAERWEEGARVSAQAGAKLIELNVSCPHGTHIMAHSPMLDTMRMAVDAARAGAPNTPVVPKITGQLDNPLAVILAMEQAGADGVVMFNRFTGLDIDVETEEPVMHKGYAGHGGPYSIHYVLRWISEVSPLLGIPIASSGGVTNGADVAKCILAGATTVQVCTAIVMHGYGIVGKILDEFEAWMDRKGHANLNEIRGAICPKVRSNDQIEREQVVVAEIDTGVCVNCGRCAAVCIYDAAQQGVLKHTVDEALCVGCGLCSELCPVTAISMVPLPEPRTFVLGVK